MISFELTATTPAGERFVRLAEEHAEVLAGRAEKHDRESTFPFENFEDLQKSKILAAAVPEEYGGLGVDGTRQRAVRIH